ncbi:MAG: hypothetical protein HRT35_21340, partial [Algicola sp.]|nr:hypothetical protein [Algicola sp.]
AAVLTPDGILDTNFGIGGIVIIDADGDEGGSTGNSFGTSVWVDGSDNLYIGTQFGMTAADYDFGVVKTSANGTLDTSFGTNGAVRADINDSQNTTAGIVLDAQGRPMVATSGRGVLKHDFALARFTVAGVLDTTFQERGYNLTNQTPSNDILHGAILLEKEPHNGKFVLVGKTTSQGSVTDVLVARFMPNGRLDLAFGVNGYFHLPDTTSGSSYLAQSIVELGDGRLVVAGQYNFNQSFLLMLDTDGKLDTTFAGDGLLLIEPTGSSSTLNSVDVDNDGKIVAVGYQFSASFDLYLIRYNVDGTPDNTFNATGTVIMDMEGGNFEGLKRVSILPDNSLIVVGNYNSQTLVAKFLSNGTLDTAGFNVGVGFQIADVDTTVDDNFDVLYDVSIASDGTIYASGASNGTVSGTDLITVLALNANGTMKTDFGGDGIVTYDFGSGHAAQSLGLDANGKLVLTGHTHNATDGGDDVFIARLTTDGAQDPLFNGGNAQLINYNETDSAEIVGVLPDGRILLGGHNTLTAEQVKVWYLSMFVLEPVAATP